MGRLQQLRAKALSLRGAIAIGGAVAVAASMTQVVGTLAASDEVRTAKLGTSTQNYFPTPLTTSVTCTTDPDRWYDLTSNRARIDWSPVTGATGYLVVFINRDDGSVYRTDDVPANQTRISGISATDPRTGIYARVHTRNGPAISSGFSVASKGMSFKDWVSKRTECEGSGGTAQANQSWENQSAWNPTMVPFAVGPTMPLFTTLMDTLNSEETLDPLPEETELAGLEAAARPAPTLTDEAKPTESTTSTAAPSTTVPSTTSPSDEAAPETSAASSSTSTAPSSTAPSTPATSTSGTTTPSTTRTSPRALPTTPLTTVSATRTTTVDAQATSTPPASTTTTTATTVRAGVGDSPIRVGEVFARLDEVDGQPRLVVMGDAGGGEVCTADVPGATRIQSADGELTVTVEGRTRAVDLATCEVG